MPDALEGATVRVAPTMDAQNVANTVWALTTVPATIREKGHFGSDTAYTCAVRYHNAPFVSWARAGSLREYCGSERTAPAYGFDAVWVRFKSATVALRRTRWTAARSADGYEVHFEAAAACSATAPTRANDPMRRRGRHSTLQEVYARAMPRIALPWRR